MESVGKELEDRPRKKRKKGQCPGKAKVEEDLGLESSSGRDCDEVGGVATVVAGETKKKKKKKQKVSDKDNVLQSDTITATQEVVPLPPDEVALAPPPKSRPLISQRVLQTTGDTSDSSSDQEEEEVGTGKGVAGEEAADVVAAAVDSTSKEGTAGKKKVSTS